MLPFFKSSISVESRWTKAGVTARTGGALGGRNCAVAGDAGDVVDTRVEETGGGVGATKLVLDVTVSVIAKITIV